MRMNPTFALTLASLLSIGDVHAALHGVCGRSHAYAVQILSLERKTARIDGDWHSAKSSAYITADERDRLVRSGEYVDGPITREPPFEYQTAIPAMQMGIDNVYGRLGLGICWWHSRFQRAAMYLMDFAPNRPKPTSSEIIVLFRRISNFQATTIPGYRSLYEVTRDFPKELGWVLSDWQIRTTVVAPQHAIGGFLTTSFTSKSEKHKLFTETAWNVVDDLFAFPRPIFLFAEERVGIHGFLALGYEVDKTDPSVIWLKFLDSNDPARLRKEILIKNGVYAGASTIAHYGVHQGFDGDFARIQSALRARCGANYQIPLR